MKKNLLLLVVSSTLTILIALGLLRWFAPQLLGISPSLQLVKVAKEVPPFFDNIFRETDYASQNFIIEDPYLSRAKPLYPDTIIMGPNDIMGFRNRQIPNVADIITIGDSQTYGNNAPLEKNWPNQMIKYLNKKSPIIYNMATGGWGAVEYLEIFSKAKYLKPRIVIIAFYTGNDPLESFVQVYGNERWAHLKPDLGLSSNDAPDIVFPAPESEWWRVAFPDGIRTIFTPKLRHASNQNHPAVKAGYAIMEKIAYEIAGDVEMNNMISENPIKVVFTIIPTKELVYAKKIEQFYTSSDENYSDLVRDEKKNLDKFAQSLMNIRGAIYIDLLEALQQAALKPVALYPENINGHLIDNGYKVIAEVIGKNLDKILPPEPEGCVLVRTGADNDQIYLIKKKLRWMFASEEIFKKNGWTSDMLKLVRQRDIANIPYGGIIDTISPDWQPDINRNF